MRSAPQAVRRDWGQVTMGLTVVGVFAALIYFNGMRGWHLIQEPLTVMPAELRAAESASHLTTPFVTLPIQRHLDTGVQLNRQTYAIKTIACDYVVIPVADRWMIAEVPAGFQGTELTGYIAPWTSGIHAEALEAVRNKIDPESLDKLLPFQLEAGHDLQAESRLMLSIGLGMILIGLTCVLLGIRKRPAAQVAQASYPQYSPAAGWPGRRMPARS